MTGSNSSKRSRLITNFFSLSAVQAATYLIPLITVPYLLRTIGTEKYGLFAFASAFAAYFQVIIDYGFNLTGIRDISQNRNDPGILSRILSEIISAKLVLLLVSCVVAAAAINFVPRLSKDAMVYYWVFISVLGTCLLPGWFFQGVEKMAHLAALNIASRFLALVLILILVKKPQDYMTLLYINAACSWTFGAIGFGYMMVKHALRPRLHFALKALRSGFGLFTTQVWAAILANSNTFVLGLFAGDATVGIYAVAEKIVKAANSLSVPVCSTIYPRSGILFKQSEQTAYRFLQKVLRLGGAYMAAVSIALFSLSSLVAAFVVGQPAPEVSFLIRIMSILPLSIFIDNIYGTQILLHINREKQVVFGIGISAVTSIVLLLLLVPTLGPRGAAVSCLCSELLVLVLFGIGVWRAGVTPVLSLRKTART
jgi:polysaccharide transporter, PST family